MKKIPDIVSRDIHLKRLLQGRGKGYCNNKRKFFLLPILILSWGSVNRRWINEKSMKVPPWLRSPHKEMNTHRQNRNAFVLDGTKAIMGKWLNYTWETTRRQEFIRSVCAESSLVLIFHPRWQDCFFLHRAGIFHEGLLTPVFSKKGDIRMLSHQLFFKCLV